MEIGVNLAGSLGAFFITLCTRGRAVNILTNAGRHNWCADIMLSGFIALNWSVCAADVFVDVFERNKSLFSDMKCNLVMSWVSLWRSQWWVATVLFMCGTSNPHHHDGYRPAIADLRQWLLMSCSTILQASCQAQPPRPWRTGLWRWTLLQRERQEGQMYQWQRQPRLMQGQRGQRWPARTPWTWFDLWCLVPFTRLLVWRRSRRSECAFTVSTASAFKFQQCVTASSVVALTMDDILILAVSSSKNDVEYCECFSRR